MAQHLEAALPVGADPRHYARALAKVREAAISGQTPEAGPRAVIGASWQRMRRLGVDPDHGRDTEPLDPRALEARRAGSGLAAVLPILRGGCSGSPKRPRTSRSWSIRPGQCSGAMAAPVRRRADGLGFVEGVCWHENVVGTNAIGTSLVARRPIQVYSAEHYVRTHHPWTCAAAPLHDPRDGRLLGVVDLSGPARTVHATTLALVDAVARLAESWLRNEHLVQLHRLRASALPALTTVPGRAVVADRHGWVAAAAGLAPVDRIAQPTRCEPGQVWLPAFGSCVLEPLPGGCLVRLAGEDGAVTRAVLDLRRSEPTLTITGTAGAWTQALSHRHPEMLYLLAVHRDGRSAAELATDLFGDSARTVTVRAEMSRLRRNFGGVLARRPYRFADDVEVAISGT